MMLRFGVRNPDVRVQYANMLPNADWDRLGDVEEKLSAAWLAELNAQGFKLPDAGKPVTSIPE